MGGGGGGGGGGGFGQTPANALLFLPWFLTSGLDNIFVWRLGGGGRVLGSRRVRGTAPCLRVAICGHSTLLALFVGLKWVGYDVVTLLPATPPPSAPPPLHPPSRGPCFYLELMNEIAGRINRISGN